jgi:hypothetical protein
MYPNADAPRYTAGFIGTCVLLVVCMLAYLTLPFWLLREANARKRKTGHAIPLRAMEDAESSQISASALAHIREINDRETQEALKKDREKGDIENTVSHVETV